MSGNALVGCVPPVGAKELQVATIVVGYMAIAAVSAQRRCHHTHQKGLLDAYMHHHDGVSPFEWLSFDESALGESAFGWLTFGNYNPQLQLNIQAILFATGIEHQPGPVGWIKFTTLFLAVFTNCTSA